MKCPACGDPGLRHREATVGKLECSACHAWVDETPAGLVTVERPAPDVQRFYVGETYCLLTMLPVAKCSHCAELAKREWKGPVLVVTEVDHATGTVTLSEAE